MIAILTIGNNRFALPKGANIAPILKALSSAQQVRYCYSIEAPIRYRTFHDVERHGADIKIELVDPKIVAKADPGFDDHGNPIEKPARRGFLLEQGK